MRPNGPTPTLLAALLGLACAAGAQAAPVTYEMNLRTLSGMGAGGATGMMGAMFGGGSGSQSRQMDLRLTNPEDIPSGYQAEHTVPKGMGVGPSLPLKGQRRGGGGSESDSGDEARILLYWGCGPTVGKGQPEVLDIRTLGSRVSPEVAEMARQSRRHGGGESLPPRTLRWPNADGSSASLPDSASAVGEHVVKASFMEHEIRYSLERDMDFLDPLRLKATGSNLKAAIPLQWAQVARARGFNLTGVGGVSDKEVIIWLAVKGRMPMLPAATTQCTVPAGIFQKAEGAVVSAEAVGPVKGFAYPPQKPGEKKPLIWSAKVRVSGYDMVMLGLEDAARGSASDAAADSVVPGGSGLMNAVKGLFGN